MKTLNCICFILVLGCASLLSAQSVTAFRLVDAASNAVIASFDPLEDGAEIVVPDMGNQAFNVIATVGGSVGSVAFDLNEGSVTQTENVAPYTLFGDSGGNFTAGAFQAGENVLTATPYSGSNKSGTAGTALTIHFELSDGVVVEPGPSSVLETTRAGLYGELQRWHRLTLAFEGPTCSETGTSNPFMDYRLQVRFVHTASGQVWTVPGYFAADGYAGESGSEVGNIWRAHFRASEIGAWTWEAEFIHGVGVAVAEDVSSATPEMLNGNANGVATGTFTISESDKSGRDNRAPDRGLLVMREGRYPRWSGSGDIFIKQGPDAPENLLAYSDFDGSFKSDGHDDSRVKSWTAHVGDWQMGDPAWQNGKGKGLIGAVNYLALEGMNAFSFLTMNIQGDDKNVFPYIEYSTFDRIDVSRMDQWEVVFEHADTLGFFLHFKTQETENELLLDNGALGPERKLYYRELIARFGHHLALNWNLGEENKDQSDTQRQEMAAYFQAHDPYGHLVVIHTFPGGKSTIYTPLLGNQSWLSGVSLQGGNATFSDVHGDVVTWVENSRNVGRPWAVAVDEPGDAQHAIQPDNDAGSSQVNGRKNALWGTLLGGGWGNEWYFGYGHAHSDLTLEDFRSRDAWWDVCKVALDLFELISLPLEKMRTDNSLSSAADDYCFYAPGQAYIVYLKNGGTTTLDLSGQSGVYDIKWYNPRAGGALENGSVLSVSGGATVGLGQAPANVNEDWLVVLQRKVRVKYIYGDVGQDGSVPSTGAPYDQMRLNDTGNTGLTAFRDMVESLGFEISEVYDADTTLDAAFFTDAEVVIFGLHQKIWSAAEKTALDDWLNTGGGMLIYSDSASGGKYSVVGAQNPVGQTVVNNLISPYGMEVLVDQANGIKAVKPTGTSLHPLVAGRPILEGEGVSPVAVDPVSGAEVLVPYVDDERVVVSGAPTISHTQNVTIANPLYAALALHKVGEGRVMVLFDRQPMWNAGPGSDISKRDNHIYLERIMRCLANQLPELDMDGDGLDDAWEQRNGLLLNVNDAEADSDQDGKSNAEEFKSRTDPRDALSHLRIEDLQLFGDTVRMTWYSYSQSGHGLSLPAYQVFASNDLTDPAGWQAISEPIYATGGMSFVDDADAVLPQFYRVEVME